MNILITAFEPFGKDTINSSQELLNIIPDNIKDKNIYKLTLPVIFDICANDLENVIFKVKPNIIVCLGQTSNETKLCVEKVAINLKHATIPDNNNNSPVDEAIFANGPTAYFSTLPIRKMVENSNKIGTPARISYSAGTYVCNNLMYHVLKMTENKDIRAGFIHIPQFTIQTANNAFPNISTKLALKGIEAMLDIL